MAVTGTCLDLALTPAYYAIDGSARVLNSRASYNLIRLVQSQIELFTLTSNIKGFDLLLNTCKKISHFASLPNFTKRVSDILSGRPLALQSVIDRGQAKPEDRIYFEDERDGFPNYIRFASYVSCAVADACGTFLFLREMGFDALKHVAQAVGSFPVFQTIGSFALASVRNTFGIIGLVLSIIDCHRDIFANGFSYYTCTKLMANVCRVAYIVLATSTFYQYMVLAQVAQSLASSLYLARFVMHQYKIGE